jgi:hypothetical protein
MTERKSFKRQVRARMAKTGERYTAARRHLVDEPVEPPVDPTALGLVSDETVANRTGRTWSEWFAVLDESRAHERSHTEIARYLNAEHGVPGWWSQTVTVGYERARGLRALHERPKGYSVTASKTVGVPVERLFEAVCDPAWPAEGALRPRTTLPFRSARFDWEDGTTRVVVGFTAKAESKSTVALEHERLADADAAERMKAFWRERLAELKHDLEERA